MVMVTLNAYSDIAERMNSMNLSRRLSGMGGYVGALLCGLMLAVTGCDNEDTSSSVTPIKFQMERELEVYSSVDYFAWDTTLLQAVVTIHIKDFSHGDATIKVYDSRGKQIFQGGSIRIIMSTMSGTTNILHRERLS
jgi:hypothetical protein